MKVVIQNDTQTKEIEISNLAFGVDINNYANDAVLMYMIPIETMEGGSNFLDETLITIPLEGTGWKIISKKR